MGDIRAIREQARRSLHREMARPALYYARRATGQTPVPCSVRKSSQPKKLGDVTGTGFAYAMTQEEVATLIFWYDEIQPVRGSVVAFAPGEAYKIDNTLPRDGQTQTAEVTLLSAAESVGLEYPDPVS